VSNILESLIIWEEWNSLDIWEEVTQGCMNLLGMACVLGQFVAYSKLNKLLEMDRVH
jgi:hypothetical protein